MWLAVLLNFAISKEHKFQSNYINISISFALAPFASRYYALVVHCVLAVEGVNNKTSIEYGTTISGLERSKCLRMANSRTSFIATNALDWPLLGVEHATDGFPTDFNDINHCDCNYYHLHCYSLQQLYSTGMIWLRCQSMVKRLRWTIT